MNDDVPAERGKTARNEKRKLVATSINALGLAVIALGTLTPLYNEPWTATLAFRALASAFAGVILHVIARRELRGLED